MIHLLQNPLRAGLTIFALLACPLQLPAQETAEQQVEVKAVAFETVVRISPENTKIEFVGTHVGEDPKPRLGGFSKFSGTIGVDVESSRINSIEVDMEIKSIWTEFDNLTQHLMNEDFFDAAKFPAARFRSTSVTMLQNGTCNVTGALTLHGKTSEIRFPAEYEFSENGLVLSSRFFLDRTSFGMDQMTDGVEKMVSLNVVVGQPSHGVESKEGHGGDSGEEVSTKESESKGTTVTVSLPNMT